MQAGCKKIPAAVCGQKGSGGNESQGIIVAKIQELFYQDGKAVWRSDTECLDLRKSEES